MNSKDLYEIDEIIYKQIQAERKMEEAKNKAFFDGMEKGADLLRKAVIDFLREKEGEQK